MPRRVFKSKLSSQLSPGSWCAYRMCHQVKGPAKAGIRQTRIPRANDLSSRE